MEEKIPHIAYTKWEEQKMKIKAEGEKISMERFIKFYTNLINIEEKAQYIRKQTRANESSQNKQPSRNFNSYYANIKPGQPQHGKGNSGYQYPNKESFKGNTTRNHQRK